MEVSSNFAFLAAQDERLARLGALAERYFFNDAPSALIKLRQLGEFIAKDVAARHGLLPSNSVTFDKVLNTLRLRSVLPREIADLFFHLKQAGNAAAHEDAGNSSQVLAALKVARAAAIWFHRSYGAAAGFKPGPFVPPTAPADATAALTAELDELRERVRGSADNEAKMRLAQQEAEAQLREREFWEQYAAETEAGLRQTEAALKAAQAAAQAAPAQQLELLAQFANQQADKVELDEATTRILVDDQLRSAGWIVDSVLIHHSAGARPEPGRALAIAEWPTERRPYGRRPERSARRIATQKSPPAGALRLGQTASV